MSTASPPSEEKQRSFASASPRTVKVAMVAVPFQQSKLKLTQPTKTTQHHVPPLPLNQITSPPQPTPIDPSMKSLSSWRRGGWKQHPTPTTRARAAHQSAPSKIDTGIAQPERLWKAQPIAYQLQGESQTQRTGGRTKKVNVDSTPSPATARQASTQQEKILIPRTEAMKNLFAQHPILQPHTLIVHEPTQPTLDTSTNNTASKTPRRTKLSKAASMSLFTNSHHFDALNVPEPPKPLTIPAVLLASSSAESATPSLHQQPATERLSHQRYASSISGMSQSSVNGGGSSTTRLLYDPEKSTLKQETVAPSAQMQLGASASTTNFLTPSASNDSLLAYSTSSNPPTMKSSTSTVNAAFVLTPQLSIEKHYFSPEYAPSNPTLGPSASVGALPYGLTPSASYDQLHLPSHKSSHVQSSPSMNQFSSPSTGSLQASLSSMASASHLRSSGSSSLADLSAAYPAEHTVDNSALITSFLRSMIKERGYKYRTRANGTVQGTMDASSDDEDDHPKQRRRKKASSEESKDSNSHSTKKPPRHNNYPRPDWDRKGIESIQAELPFELLFGLEDSATRLKRRKREKRIEEERLKRERFAQSELKDDEQVRLVRDGFDGPIIPSLSDEEREATNGKRSSANPNGDNKTDPSNRSHILVPANLSGVTTTALTTTTTSTDPLNPRPNRPTLLTAAARVLLRKELQPPSLDANLVSIAPPGSKALTKAPTASNKPKGIHDLVTAKTTVEDDEPIAGGEQLVPANHRSKFLDPKRAVGTMVEHSSRVYNSVVPTTHPQHHASHLSHNVHTYAQQLHSQNRDLKSNMESWLRVRMLRHRRLLEEEDRLKARELFDMLLLASAGAEHQKMDVSQMHAQRAAGSRPRDPSSATIEIESMRKALKNIGMDASTEELAFRLQKLSEYHATIRSNAAAGISAKINKSAMNHQISTSSLHHHNTLYLNFNDFLSIYEHISQWDELVQYKQLKAQKKNEEIKSPRRKSPSHTGAATPRKSPKADKSASKIDSSTTNDSKESTAPTDNNTSDQVILATRTDENLRKIELPFFLMIPAAHRSERINELVRVYGQPSLVGLGIGFDEKELEEEYNKEMKQQQQGGGGKKKSHKYGSKSKSLLSGSRSHKRLQSTRSASQLQRHPLNQHDSDQSESEEEGATAIVAGDDGSSSSEDDITGTLDDAPTNIVRTLVDELNPSKLVLPPVATATTSQPPSSRKHQRRPSQSVKSSSKKKPQPKSGGAYWGSQQVLRALHFKNLSLSTSTLQTNRVLTHETVAPAMPTSNSNSTTTTPLTSPRTNLTTPSSKRTVFVSPLQNEAIPENESVDEVNSNQNQLSSSVVVSRPATSNNAPKPTPKLSPQFSPSGRRVSTPVREIQAAMLARAEQHEREVAELVKEVEAKLAGRVLETTEEQPTVTEQPAEPSTNEVKKEDSREVVVSPEPPKADEPANTTRTKTPRKEAKSPGRVPPTLTAPIHSHRKTPRRPSEVQPATATHLISGTRATQLSTQAATVKQAPELIRTMSTTTAAVEEEDKPEVMQLTDPMIKAAKSGAWEDVLMLIQTSAGDNVKLRNAYVNRRDKNGSSAIFHCVWLGHFKVLEVLLYHGADPNVQNNRLNTALHLCTEKGHRKLIRLLIEMGASIELRNWQNKTCLDVIPIEEIEEQTVPAVIVPAGSAPPDKPSQAALLDALRTHAATEASDSLKAFVLECAADAKRKKEQDKLDTISGLASVSVSGAVGNGSQPFNFVEYANRRDAAAAATRTAASVAAASLSLLGPDGKPAVDLWELTAADRRSAGIRGNFLGADALQRGGQHQSHTLTGDVLIHTAASAKGLTANQNAMGAYKESFITMNDPVAQETRARIVAGLVREELAHSSLHQLWAKTQKTVASRATVISSTDDLLMANSSRMDKLRQSNQQQQERIQQVDTDVGAFVVPPEPTSKKEEHIFTS